MQKPLFFIFVIILFSQNLSAQKISVASFRILENDLDARVYHPETDQNGDKCALIKVVTTETGYKWEGGSLGITKVEKKTGEFWVYVPYGSKKITIKHDKLGVLRNYIYTESIHEATVYEMVLTTDIVKTIVEKRKMRTQWVVINTEPEGADVYIDDKHSGQTPFSEEFKEGKHIFRISKDLYHTEAGQFELSSEDEKEKMDFKLSQNYGFINIKTTPEAGATIFIDDVVINNVTPHKTDRIKSGKHTVLLTHKWYEDAQKEIEVKDEETAEAIINMKPKFAEVVIKTTPEAEIFINGNLEGNGNFEKRLMAGNYIVEIKKAMYHNITETIEIKAGEAFTKNFTLQPAFGGISIQTTPENGAEVSVDDKPSGKKTPCTLDRLPSGEYIITLRREWYEPKKIRITIEDGKSQNITQELTPTFVEITITTSPKSDIYVDDQKVGNETYTGRIKTGIHIFEARKEHHHTASKKEEIVLDKEYNIALSPTPKYGDLKVVSNPIDATITLNGKETGTTPKTFYDLLVGEYSIELTKKGYASISKTANITENETEEINIELASTKQITINSTPQGAKLFINNEYKGTTPFTTELSFETHSIKLTKDNHEGLSQSIEITETSSNINLTLKRLSKQITINSKPQGAKLYIDNEYKGTTPYTTELSSGKYNVKLSKTEYKDLSKSIEIREYFNKIDLTLESIIKEIPGMVFVKGGCFNMGSNNGSNDEKPIHKVCVDDFYIGKYEVTQKQWKEIMGNNPSRLKGDNLPVERVSWNKVKKFIKKLNQKTGKNYRLPTEAEWEYAARGGASKSSATATKYSGSNNIDDVAWYIDNSGSKTHAVGRKQANELGIYDMSGNVWEWCSDWYGKDYYSKSPKSNPKGPGSGQRRVLRGGCWYNYSNYCQVAFRDWRSYFKSNHFFLGFRIVR